MNFYESGPLHKNTMLNKRACLTVVKKIKKGSFFYVVGGRCFSKTIYYHQYLFGI